MFEKLKSRKLLATFIGALFLAVGGGMTGALEWPEVMKKVTDLIMVFVGTQGAVDVADKLDLRGPKK